MKQPATHDTALAMATLAQMGMPIRPATRKKVPNLVASDVREKRVAKRKAQRKARRITRLYR